MNLKTAFLATAIGSLIATAAQANVVTYTGNTLTGPTYDRVNIDSSTATPTGVSSTGTAVNYNAYSFTVGTSGTYSITTAGAFDTFGTLYAGGFNPASSTTNAVAGNDDLTAGIGTSGLSFNLTAGTTYTYVTSAFLNGEGGFFSTSIGGGGTVTPTTATTPATPSSRVLTYTGTTVGGKTYDRADTDGSGGFFLSSDATSVAYSTFSFQVGAIGTYSFIANGAYDTFLSLYRGAFNPSNALTNLVDLNDDAYNGASFLTDVSAFADDLIPGVVYTLVTSGYGNGDGGFFSNAIVGPGAVARVSEPGVLALMFAGVGLMGVAARRRKSTRA